MRSIFLVVHLTLALQLDGDTASVTQPDSIICSRSDESATHVSEYWREILGFELVISFLVRVGAQKN